MNKKRFVSMAIMALLVTGAFAQKFAFVDTEYMLANIPEYKQAQGELDKTSMGWQKEIEAKYAEIDKLYKAYQAEQILLTEDMKKKREAEIVGKEKEAKEIQKQHFGVDGDLFKKRQELVKPIQDKIYKAVKELAEKQTYAIIFDKSSELTMLFTNPKYDKSDEILEALGYKAEKSEKDKKK
jgi:outer membrane protein